MLSPFELQMTLRRGAQFIIARVEIVYLELPGQDFAGWITFLNIDNL